LLEKSFANMMVFEKIDTKFGINLITTVANVEVVDPPLEECCRFSGDGISASLQQGVQEGRSSVNRIGKTRLAVR